MTAVQDASGTLYNPNGIDPDALLAYQKENKGLIAGFPGAQVIDASELFAVDCEICIPAALGNQITEANAAQVKASVIAEGANGPTTPQAEEILREKGVDIIPDILCNSGGVIGSYFEWLQNRNGEIWEFEDVITRLEKKLLNSFGRVVATADEYKTDFRTAAYIEAIKRIELTYNDRGVFP